MVGTGRRDTLNDQARLQPGRSPACHEGGTSLARWSANDARRIRDIEAHLGTYVHGGPPALESLVEPLRELLATEKTVAYSLRQRGETLGSELVRGARVPAPRIGELLNQWLWRGVVRFGCFNPIRPEPWQRNAVVSLADLHERGGLTEEGTAYQRAVYPQVSLEHRDQLRVLVCEGPSLLAWVGAFQPDPFDSRQKRLLSAIVRPLHRRLRLERQMGAMSETRAALDAALEAVGRPAFVIGPAGDIRHANAAGRALLDEQRSRVARSLADAARRRPSELAFALTPLRNHGAATGYLALAKGGRCRERAHDPCRGRVGPLGAHAASA